MVGPGGCDTYEVVTARGSAFVFFEKVLLEQGVGFSRESAAADDRYGFKVSLVLAGGSMTLIPESAGLSRDQAERLVIFWAESRADILVP